jgi:hypothetical protein
MAVQFKYTAKREAQSLADVVIAAGAAEAQSDTISLNMDITDMSKGEALVLIDKIREQVHASIFPPL